MGIEKVTAEMSRLLEQGRGCRYCTHNCYKLVSPFLSHLTLWRTQARSSLSPAALDVEILWIFGRSRTAVAARTTAAGSCVAEASEGSQTEGTSDSSPRQLGTGVGAASKRQAESLLCRDLKNKRFQLESSCTESSGEQTSDSEAGALVLQPISTQAHVIAGKRQQHCRRYQRRVGSKKPSVQLKGILSTSSLFVCKQAAVHLLGIGSKRVLRASLLF